MSELRWYVAYTKYRKEFQLSDGLTRKNIESYFPVDSNGLALFSCYVFVYACDSQLHRVNYLPGFSNWVSFGSEPATIPSEQVLAMQRIAEYSQAVSSQSTQLLRGDAVRIVKGPLRGIVGKLVEDQGKRKLAMEINQLNQAMLVTIPLDFVVPLGEERLVDKVI